MAALRLHFRAANLLVASAIFYVDDTTYVVIISLSLSILTAIFPDEPGLVSFIEAEDDGRLW